MATILVVDDNATLRELLCALLASEGHRALEAAHGAEALPLAQTEHPDLLITDLLMPTMDGFELLRQFRSDLAHRRLLTDTLAHPQYGSE